MQLSIECQNYINQVLAKIEDDPKLDYGQHVIQPSFHILQPLKLFIWCPIRQYGCKLYCPTHGTKLTPGSWTSCVDKTDPRNPRLVYDIFGNILLIQSMYYCPGFKNNVNSTHKILSADSDIVRSLEPKIRSRFCIKKYHRSAVSKQLLEYIFDQVIRGVNFLQISQAISSFHLTYYNQRKSQIGNTVTDISFYDNCLFSSPGNDQVMAIFLDEFQKCRLFFEKEMEKVELGNVLSTDHTFKVGKHIGYRRSGDSKFVKQFGTLFIVLNESKQVVSFKLCSSTKQKDILQAIENLSTHSSASKVNLIMVDNCCMERSFYQSFFNTADVKLDLFHAVQRVVKEFPKTLAVRKAAKHFGLCFRAVSDLGEKRSKATPEPSIITTNIRKFLKHNQHHIVTFPAAKRKKIDEEINKLMHHVEKGCLSYIPTGCGTESNEALHRLLNRSMLRGATSLSPELAEAVLTVLFHHYNETKTASNHISSKRIKICKGRESCETDFVDVSALTKCSFKSNVTTPQNCELEESLGVLLGRKILFYNVCASLFENIVNFKGFSLADHLLSSLETDYFLEYNILQCCGLKIDETPALYSGNSFINAILVQLDRMVSLKKKILDFFNMKSLDFLAVRLKENIDNMVGAAENNLSKHQIATAVAECLQIFIITIDDKEGKNFNIHVPIDLTDHAILFVVYDKEKEIFYPAFFNDEYSSHSHCNCGKNTSNNCCSTEKCPCVLNGVSCVNSCRCKRDQCLNKDIDITGLKPDSKVATDERKCRCGEGRKSEEAFKSCVHGQRKTRCPCYNNNSSCSSLCRCYNCANDFGARSSEVVEESSMEPIPRKKRKDVTYQRLPSKQYLEIQGETINQGGWTNSEKLCLYVCWYYLAIPNVDHLFNVYNKLREYTSLEIREKSKNMIRSKTSKLLIGQLT